MVPVLWCAAAGAHAPIAELRRGDLPLVVAFDEAPGTFGSGGTSFFPPTGSTTTAWPSRRTPWLGHDLDGSGCLESGRELFGPFTELPNGHLARDGFEALSALDSNGDGIIDDADLDFPTLLLWADDGDHVCQLGEVTAVSRRLTSVSLRATRELRPDGELLRASVRWKDDEGATHSGSVVEVSLRELGETKGTASVTTAVGSKRTHEALVIDGFLLPVAGALAVGGLQRDDGAAAQAMVTVAGALGGATLGLLVALLAKGDKAPSEALWAVVVGLGAGLVLGGVSAGIAGGFAGTPRTVAAVSGVGALVVGAAGLTIGFW